MLKSLLSLLLVAMFCGSLKAQDIDPLKDTVIYYFKNSEVQVNERDSADYLRVSYPPNKQLGEKLFTIKEYYMNGNLKFYSKSYSNYKYPYVVGECIEYFPNGIKKSVRNYHKGGLIRGDAYEYYPNGNLYTIINYNNYLPKYKECRDINGNFLTKGGQGKWVAYYDDYKTVVYEREVKRYTFPNKDTVSSELQLVKYEFKYAGSDTLQQRYYKDTLLFNIFHKLDTLRVPKNEMPGYISMRGLYRAILEKITCPILIKNKITAIIVISFDVNAEGKYSNLKILKEAGYGSEEVIVTALYSIPPWKPLPENGKHIQFSRITIPIILNGASLTPMEIVTLPVAGY
ncbi:MAG: hypothetical protein EOO89_10030 [Pedobacter sp.]|nr:MAG: hypothetical protein EOO89_10030 [Pedobacter sp.]